MPLNTALFLSISFSFFLNTLLSHWPPAAWFQGSQHSPCLPAWALAAGPACGHGKWTLLLICNPVSPGLSLISKRLSHGLSTRCLSLRPHVLRSYSLPFPHAVSVSRLFSPTLAAFLPQTLGMKGLGALILCHGHPTERLRHTFFHTSCAAEGVGAMEVRGLWSKQVPSKGLGTAW